MPESPSRGSLDREDWRLIDIGLSMLEHSFVNDDEPTAAARARVARLREHAFAQWGGGR